MKLRSALVLSAFVAAGGTAWAGGGKIKWETDFKKGLTEARSSGKPIVLYFTADW